MSEFAALLPCWPERHILAWHQGQAVWADQFRAEAQALALTLPAHGSAVNLCQDRYHFALGLVAAALRGHTSLMPPDTRPGTLQQLPAVAPYALVDAAGAEAGAMPVVVVSRQRAAAASAHGLPGLAPQQQAVCLLTSGSTGAPQPHGKRWAQLSDNIATQAQRLAQLLGRPSLHGLALLATVPPQHSYGLESSVLLALLGGACLVDARPFYPADIVAALHALPRPRALVTTPLHLKTLLLSGLTLPPVDLVLSATAPLSLALAEQAEQHMGGPLVEIYGCTEAGQVATRRTTQGDVWQALDRLHLQGRAGPLGQEYWVSGGHVIVPTLLADQLGLLDSQHFRLHGRANDLIHVAGKRSSLAHLNHHLNRIPGVIDGAFWLPPARAEEVVRPLALVVTEQLSSADIIQALRAQLEPAFVPRRVLHVAQLPRSATGKLTTQALEAFARQVLAAQAPAVEAAAPLPRPTASAAGHAALPHRSQRHIEHDHPAFAGHFPGQPVLPGVVLLSLVFEELQLAAALANHLGPQPLIEQVKFLVPVGPGDVLEVRLHADGTTVAFALLRAQQVVARGRLGRGGAA